LYYFSYWLTILGFRFVELTGYPGTPDLSTIFCKHAYSSVASTGEISFNIPLLNQIQHNIQWGQQSNLMSVPTDCDQRDERLGWMADGHVSIKKFLYLFLLLVER
jgi:alpha-L-rhamnosidase